MFIFKQGPDILSIFKQGPDILSTDNAVRWSYACKACNTIPVLLKIPLAPHTDHNPVH